MKRLLLVACVLLMSACAKDIYDLTGDIQGVVKDYSDGHLITNCLVSLQPSGKSTLTDSQGQFSFEDLTPGEYSLVFNKSGYNEESKKVTVITGQITEAMQLLRAKSPFSLSESLIDFGDFETQKTLMLFNNTDSKCSYTISNVPSWLSLSAMTGSLPAEGTNSLTLTINKDRVSNYGEYSQTLTFSYQGRSSGDVNLVVKFKKVQKTKPTVTCASKAENITETSFTISGELTATGGQLVTSYGHCWSLSPNPTIANNRNNNGTTTEVGKFESSISGLTTATTYYVRAYAENASGVAYSNQVVVTTNDAYSNKWDGSTASSFAKGSGTSSNPYIIETGAQLNAMRNHSDKYFELANNIDLNNLNWKPFVFSGTLDGAGYAILNLYINRDESNLGLFSQIGYYSGLVKNLTIKGVKIEAENSDNVGAIAGFISKPYDDPVMLNCKVILSGDSIIQGNDNVGGLVGGDQSGSIENCVVEALSPSNTITGNMCVGGLCGLLESDGEVSSCKVSAYVVGSQKVGGICGKDRGPKIEKCLFAGKVSGGSEVGGILGYNYGGGHIIACKVSADIETETGYCGGIVGYTNTSTEVVTVSCYATGTMKSTGSKSIDYVGGIYGGFGGVAGDGSIHCYSAITTELTKFDGFGLSSYGSSYDVFEDCCTTSYSRHSGNNSKSYCTDITSFMRDCYSEYASDWNYNNTWTWNGKVNGTTKSVSCPKLAWEE